MYNLGIWETRKYKPKNGVRVMYRFASTARYNLPKQRLLRMQLTKRLHKKI